MGARSWLIPVAAAVAALLVVGRTATALFVDHAWFEAMGVPALFWEQVIDTVLLQGGAWAAGSLFAFANLHAVRQTILAVAMPSRVANLELTAMVPARNLLSATIVLSLIVGGVLALPLTNWEALALVRHGVPFEEIEGIFDHDLGHYLYWLPFEETLYLWSLVSVVSLTAMVLVLYALTRSLRLEGRRIAVSTHVRRHLSVLGALVLLLLAWSYRLDGFDLLLAGSGPDGLFLRVDHRVTLRVDQILAYGSALAALIILRTGWTGQLRVAFVTLTIVLVSAIGLRHAVPPLLARGAALGDPARRDADYIAARALYSRRAFDVDAIRSAPLGDTAAATPSATAPVPMRTSLLATRASLWDAGSLADGLGLRPFGRGGNAARDLTTTSDRRSSDPERREAGQHIDVSAPSWSLLDGRVTALRVGRPVSGGGNWRLSLIDATQPVVRDSVLGIGVLADDARPGPWPLVAPGLGGARLLDAASAGDIPGALLDTPQARIAHAWALRDISLLGADSANGTPLLVMHRDVRERVRRLAPIFEQGATMHAVRDGQELHWVLHLYSASDRYPFSQRWQVGDRVVNYYKLAATAIVEASTGRVRLVPAPRPDALARTWITRLPRLFTSPAALPATVAAQLPTATDGAAVQVRTFARYGSRQVGSVTRHLPDSAFVDGPPAPLILDRAGSPLPAWSLPLLDDQDAVAGVVTATGGLDQTVYWTPAGPPTVVWPLMLQRVRGAVDSLLRPEDEATVDDRGGSRALPRDSARRASAPRDPAWRDSTARDPRWRLGRPEALVTTRGLLYLQGVRTTNDDGRLVFQHVAVTDGQRVGLGATVAEALVAIGERVELAGGDEGARTGPVWPAAADDPARWYDAMRQAMRQGNWSAFGAAFDSLGRALGRPPQ